MGCSGRKYLWPGTVGRGVVIAALSLTLSACAGKLPAVDPGAVPDIAKEPVETAAATEDPWESINRATFWFNLKMDRFLLRPAAVGYRFVLPGPVQRSVRNVLDNASAPVTMANDLFQGELKRGGTTFGRLITNSTVGVGGIFDVAARLGWEKHKADFGQTLAIWGTNGGPYLMLPVMGPSNVRDGFGRAVDVFLNPLTYVYFIYDVEYGGAAQRALEAIDFRARNLERIDDLEASSVDYYAAIRSAYGQARHRRIFGDGGPNKNLNDDAFDDFE